MTNYRKPLPEPTRWTKPFWDACKKHELHIQQCVDCRQYIMYPKLYCPYCLSENLKWVRSEGKGKIYSYTIVHNNPPTSFADQLPYVVAVVELTEGVRMATNIVDSDFNDLACDIPVEVVFDDVTDEITLPKFKISK